LQPTRTQTLAGFTSNCSANQHPCQLETHLTRKKLSVPVNCTVTYLRLRLKLVHTVYSEGGSSSTYIVRTIRLHTTTSLRSWFLGRKQSQQSRDTSVTIVAAAMRGIDNFETYYSILGVERTASTEEICK